MQSRPRLFSPFCFLLGLAWLLAGLAHASPAAASRAPAELALRFEAVGQNGVIPNNVLSALAQDRQGFLWVGSAAGLLRFDGYSFRQLQLDTAAEGGRRSLGFVRVLLVGRDGRLWIGSDSGGLAVHDPASERTQLYSHQPAQPDRSVPEGTVLALAEAPDGQLWLGTALHGLSRFDPARQSFVHYRHEPGRAGSLPDNSVQALLLDREGTLWVGGLGGLARKAAGSEQFEPVPLPTRARAGSARPAQPIVLRLAQAEDGQIWVGTQQGDLALVDPGSRRVSVLEQNGPRGAVYALTQASPGLIWVGRAGGVELRAADGRLQQILRHNPRNPSSLGGNEVRCLLLDRGGWMWVGGFGGGLQRHDADQLSIGVRKLDEHGDAVFEDPSARALLELDRGEVWVGTTAQGLGVLDAQLRLHRQIDLRSALKRRADEPVRVSTLARARDGTVWVGVDSQLLRVDAQGRLLQSMDVAHGRLRRTVLARNGDLWVGTQDGLYQLLGGQGPALRHHLAGGAALRGELNAIVEAEDGALWVGGEAGLFLRPAGAREFQIVPTVAGQGLRNGIVTGLLIDRRQRLWVDTATGLHQMTSWDGHQASFDAISERKGIAGRAFGANLLDDERGRVWSQNYVYDPNRDHLYELTPADGADAGTSWFRSYARLQDGRFLFGAARGLMVVDPERFEAWAYQPPVVASELRINGERVNAGMLVTQGLQLLPQQRSFGLEFSALDYSDPGRVRYAYQLEGYDGSWINTSATQRLASYSNLSPGHYLLRVRASNRSGVWSPHELAIPIQVHPAWWQTWWLRLALALGGAGLLYVLVRWRTGYLERRQLGLEQRVRERTAELEDLSAALQEKSRALEEKSLALEDLSLSDPLTGLRNRRFLAQHIEADVALTLRRHEAQSRQGGPLPEDADLIFFLIDIDHFKDINDRFGHAAGDRMLKQMRDRLRQVFRDTDYLVRWGGEEFLIVARGSPRSHAPELAERMRALVAEQPFVLDADGLVLHKTCSIGFACFPISQQHPRALDWNRTVDVADAMLYAVKRGGRDGWMGVLQASSGTAQQLRERAAADWLQDEGVLRVSSALRPG